MPHYLTIREKLVETKKAGFDYMEISIDETDEKLERLGWDRDRKQKIVEAVWDTGIPIYSMCLSGHRKYPLGSEDAETRSKGLKIMSDAIDFAAEIGIRVIQIAGYDEYYKPSTHATRKNFSENLKKSAEMAARKGVILAFETMETEFLNTVGKAMVHVEAVGSPFLQVYPDLGNITNAAVTYGTKVSDDLESGRGHIVALHLKETVPGVFRERAYGTGHVNFLEGISIAKGMGVNMYVGEFWYVGNDDWKAQLVSANGFLRGNLDRAYGSD
jgi:predicted hexulose-6-phosphate isomerase